MPALTDISSGAFLEKLYALLRYALEHLDQKRKDYFMQKKA